MIVTSNFIRYLEIEPEKFNECLKYNKKTICPKIKTVRKDFDKSCLYQLYQNQQDDVTDLCEVQTIKRREQAVEINPGEFIIMGKS